jgi:hypothetical protein
LVDALNGAAKIVRGLRAGLTVSEREAVAELAVAEIRNLLDDPWKLGEQLPQDWNSVAVNAPGYRGGSTPDNWQTPFNEIGTPVVDRQSTPDDRQKPKCLAAKFAPTGLHHCQHRSSFPT